MNCHYQIGLTRLTGVSSNQSQVASELLLIVSRQVHRDVCVCHWQTPAAPGAGGSSHNQLMAGAPFASIDYFRFPLEQLPQQSPSDDAVELKARYFVDDEHPQAVHRCIRHLITCWLFMSGVEVSDSTSLSVKNNVSAYKLLVVRDGELVMAANGSYIIILVYRLQCTNYQSIFFLWFYTIT